MDPILDRHSRSSQATVSFMSCGCEIFSVVGTCSLDYSPLRYQFRWLGLPLKTWHSHEKLLRLPKALFLSNLRAAFDPAWREPTLLSSRD